MSDKNTVLNRHYLLRISDKIIDLSLPKVMGIINLTSDSFYAESRVKTNEVLISKVSQMLSDGATFIDLGAYSSRPGAIDISETEEVQKLLPAIKLLKQHFPNIILSIDTFRATVADMCLNEGADIINDIYGGGENKQMYEVIAKHQAPYILMHCRGTAQNMQENTLYNDIVDDLYSYFIPRIKMLTQLGVNNIILDPGFGFAKTTEQNYELLHRLREFIPLELPILVGISRKSMIYKKLQIDPLQSLNGTTILNTVALLNGANILRVHDVKEAIECIKLLS